VADPERLRALEIAPLEVDDQRQARTTTWPGFAPINITARDEGVSAMPRPSLPDGTFVTPQARDARKRIVVCMDL
jgi:hypothetical protein